MPSLKLQLRNAKLPETTSNLFTQKQKQLQSYQIQTALLHEKTIEVLLMKLCKLNLCFCRGFDQNTQQLVKILL